MSRRAAAGMLSLMVVACSSGPKPAPQVPPVPAPAPAPAAPVSAPDVSRAAGTYRLDVRIESGNRPQPRNRRDPQASLTLATDTAAVKVFGPSAQYAASVTIPGYSRPSRRGRPGQSAAWWPVAGDSIVVQFTQGPRSRGEIQLRGALRGNALSGEVWYVSDESGSNFQLGTFTGSKTDRNR